MCIIAAKPAGVKMPEKETMRTMWDRDPDGAGFMYVEKGKVMIEKGFMTYKSFSNAIDKVSARLDLKETPIIMHFRIATAGGIKPENTHPFPISDSIGVVRKLMCATDVGVAHNGCIPITPSKGISDTMEYVISQLAPLKKAVPRFYENKHAMTLVENAICSKMAFLTKEGNIYTIGDFIEEDGVLYSNSNYKKSYRFDSFKCYGMGDEYLDFFGENDQGEKDFASEDLMWLDDGEYVQLPDGSFEEGYDFLIDEDGNVYVYDFENDLVTILPEAVAYDADLHEVKFDEEKSGTYYVLK